MKLTGTFKKRLPDTTYGEGKKIAHFLFGYSDFDKEKIIAFKMFEKSMPKIAGINAGEQVEVSFSVESREYQGKYYTDCVAFDCSVISGSKSKPAEFRVPDNANGIKDDLPF